MLLIAYKLLLYKRKGAFPDHMDGVDNLLAFSPLYLVAVSVRYTVGHAGYEDTGLFPLGGKIYCLKYREAMDLSVSQRSCTQIIFGTDQAGRRTV